MSTVAEEKVETHVLMVAFSAQGHINPMLRLGARLISKGLHVTLATTEVARQRMLNSSAATTTAVAASCIAGIRLEFFSDGLSLDYDRKTNLEHVFDTLGRAGPKNLSAIINTHAQQHGGRKFSCIVGNPFIPWVADVAAEHGIPAAMFWIQPLTLYSIYYRFYNNLNPFPTLENPTMSVELPGLPLLNTDDLPSFVRPSNPFGSIPKLLSDLFQIQSMKKHNWVLANSFDDLEKDVIGAMSDIHPVRPIGPLVPLALFGEEHASDAGIDMWKSEDGCIEWLDQQEPSSVIYVSFGSLVVLPAKEMESIASALQNVNRPFLWVVKRADYAAKDGAAAAEGQPPLGFLEATKGVGQIVSWCPQTKVLMHPAVGCFLSHCGWNSILETIAAGVPVIAYPQWTDQPTNAKLVSDVRRIGVRVQRNQDGVVTHEEVERCIEEITSGPNSTEYKRNATELKEAARNAVADGGSSDRNIQLFVDEIIGRSRSSTP